MAVTTNFMEQKIQIRSNHGMVDGQVGTLTANRLFTEQLSVISFDSDGSTPHFARDEFACDCQGATCDGFPAEMNLKLLLRKRCAMP